MFNETFKCTFLSDIILNSRTATEGNQESLNYIPGANFLGIVAKKYKNYGDKSYDIFHSGKVQFGDAHLSKNNKRSLKQPASWFYKKNDDKHKTIYIHHAVSDEMRKKFTENKQQLKQIRSGYFIEDQIISSTHDFSIKSAHNKKERRSEEGAMYGYDALRKGSEYIFTVNSEDESTLKEITSELVGKHNIGKSKTAQYGRILIEKVENFSKNYKEIDNPKFTVIYFESCCAFLDKNGNFTYQPELKDLGFEGGEIKWEKSQIQTKTFAPWNNKRKNRDADRSCIDKGSVIYIEGGKVDKEFIKKGLGVFKNEGFGRVIINPDFLVADSNAEYNKPPQKNDNNKRNSSQLAIVKNGIEDQELLNLLHEKQNESEKFNEIVKATNNFIKKHEQDFKNISPSQWGSIRSRAQKETNLEMLKKDLFRDKVSHMEANQEVIDDRGGYLRHGKTEASWRGLYKTLEKELNNTDATITRRFLVNLCSAMAKRGEK